MKTILHITQAQTIAAEHIFLRPTRLCGTLLVLSVAIWFGAVNYQVNVAYAVCFWVLGFIGVSALFTKRQLLGLKMAIVFQDEVFAGQTAQVCLQFSDENAQRARLLWWHGEHGDNQISTWQTIKLNTGSLKKTEHIWQIPIQQRGYFPDNLFVNLATSAPFGLFQAACRVHWQTSALAYPSPLPHQDFGAHAQADSEQVSQINPAHGEDLAYLKPHQQGGSLQRIAWKVYAKRGELMDKVFDDAPLAHHSETISYRDYPQGTPRDKLASLLAHRVLQAEKWGAVYSLELPHTQLTPQHGMREKCLNALALM